MSAFKKSFLAIIFGMTIAAPAVSMATAQPVVDVDSLNELKQIRAILEQDSVQTNISLNELKQIRAVLEQHSVKTYTCIDGDLVYTAGIYQKINGNDYRCTVKGDHAEWEISFGGYK